jgi:hypothetical protein
MTPVIVADGAFSYGEVARRFEEASGGMDAARARFISEALRGFPRAPAGREALRRA